MTASLYKCASRNPSSTRRSEVDAGLEAERQGVGDPARPARPDDVLQAGLEEQSVSEKSQAIRPLQCHLIPLHANRQIELLRAPLRVLPVVAEMTVDEAKAP